MKDNVGVFLGRFQPFHKGHEITVKRMLDMHDNVLILIGSADKSGTARNPFDVNIRAEIIREWIRHEGLIGRVRVRLLNDLTTEEDNDMAWGSYLYLNIIMHIDEWVKNIGKNFTIHYSDSIGIIDKWFETGNLPPRLEWYIQNRSMNQNGVSATMIREALSKGGVDNLSFLALNLPLETFERHQLLSEKLKEIK